MEKQTATKELLEECQQQLDSANAALAAAKDRVTEAQHALEAARHQVELYSVNIADDTLVAPRDGRIQYRIANVGEVLPAGGHVFAMLDINYVYMDVYLPTNQAGKVKFGADGRIVVDAYSILFRGAGIDVVWPEFLAVFLIAGLFFVLAILRFRSAAAQTE